MSQCANIRELLCEWLDGELSAEQREAVERHLQGCEVCREELESLRNAASAVQGLPRRAAPPTVLQAVRSGLREADAAGAGPAAAAVPARPHYWRAGWLSAAAVVLVAVLVYLAYAPHLPQGTVPIQPPPEAPGQPAAAGAAAPDPSRGQASDEALARGREAQADAPEATAGTGGPSAQAKAMDRARNGTFGAAPSASEPAAPAPSATVPSARPRAPADKLTGARRAAPDKPKEYAGAGAKTEEARPFEPVEPAPGAAADVATAPVRELPARQEAGPTPAAPAAAPPAAEPAPPAAPTPNAAGPAGAPAKWRAKSAAGEAAEALPSVGAPGQPPRPVSEDARRAARGGATPPAATVAPPAAKGGSAANAVRAEPRAGKLPAAPLPLPEGAAPSGDGAPLVAGPRPAADEAAEVAKELELGLAQAGGLRDKQAEEKATEELKLDAEAAAAQAARKAPQPTAHLGGKGGVATLDTLRWQLQGVSVDEVGQLLQNLAAQRGASVAWAQAYEKTGDMRVPSPDAKPLTEQPSESATAKAATERRDWSDPAAAKDTDSAPAGRRAFAAYRKAAAAAQRFVLRVPAERKDELLAALKQCEAELAAKWAKKRGQEPVASTGQPEAGQADKPTAAAPRAELGADAGQQARAPAAPPAEGRAADVVGGGAGAAAKEAVILLDIEILP